MNHGFQRMLVVHDGEGANTNLLNYAALLASRETEPTVVVAETPGNPAPHSVAAAAKAVFAARGVEDVEVRLLTEPDLDAVFDAARECGATLMVVNHPRALSRGRALGRRLITESPCSVCAVPEGAAPRLDRVVAGVELSPEGAELLERMAHVCASWGAEELFAVNVSFRETLASGADIDDRFQQESMLDLYRFMARVPLNGTRCTPVFQEHARYYRAILRAAKERDASIVVIGRPVSHPWLAGHSGREELLWECPVPLLQVGAAEVSFLGTLKKRLLTAPEPQFN